MTTTQRSRSIQERIDSISSKASEVADLVTEVDNIKAKRERAESKNRGFESLDNQLGDVGGQYDRLETWVAIADEFDVTVDRGEIRSAIDAVDSEIQSLLDKQYNDFHDRSDVDEMEESFKDQEKALRDLTWTVESDVQDVASEESQSVDRIRSLLQIPDIGTDDDDTVCATYQKDLTSIKHGHLHEIDIGQLSDNRNAFHSLDIGLGDELSDEAKDVIWKILEDEEVTLAGVSSEVLTDLKRFEEFSERLTVEFRKPHDAV